MNTVDTSVLAKVRQAIQAGATKLSLAGLPLARLPEELSKATTLRTLDLSGCMQLQDLQPLAKLTALRSLNLGGCEKLRDFNLLAKLTALQSLDLSGCVQLQDLQPLAKLTALRSLNLSGCEKLQDLQPLVKLTALRSLDLSGCEQLQNLQPLVKLAALRSLDLSWFEKLQNLQPLAKLTALRSLDLSGCEQLQDLQPLAGLAALQSLNLRWCKQLQDLQPLAGLAALQSLDLTACGQLQDLQPLAGLAALQSLNLSGCEKLQELQPLVKLTALRSLYLSDCEKLQDLQPLAKLTALQSLYLGGCVQLQDLQPLAGLTTLQSLNLSWCKQLQDLQPLAKLTALQSLNLSGCEKLQDLQPLVKLAALRSLNLSWFEKLQDLQPLVKLTALRSLILRGCEKLQDLQPLVKLTALRSLDLSGCKKLQDLQPLAKLTALRSLDLSGCKKLRDLQPLAKLTALRSLDLGGCRQLQDLQPLAGLARLGSFQLLESVSFNCDPGAQPLASWGGLEALYCDHLMGPPSELGSREGNDNALPRIRAWQRDIAHGEAANSAVKVFLLGNGWVGKTQVARRLRDEPFDQSVPSTHGITLSAVQLAAARGGLPAVDAVVWDFGGQDIYLGTHALFLDERAIYVIAWTPAYENADETEREGMLTRNRPLAYWLEYARSLGGEQAPVIVVQTQCDGELQVRAPALPPDHGFARLRVTSCSAKQDDGMEGLQLELKSAARYQLERYGKVRLPASWVKITGKLRARADEKTLPRAEFERLCAKGHSAAVPGVVLEYLHRSGQVFYRQGVFDDAVVLDLGWALAGVYAVLNRRTALPEIRRSAGRFSPQVLAALAWRDYGEEEHRLFISLMEQCQICFQVAEDVYIAPALLPQQEAMKDAIEHVWRGGDPNAIARLDYAFLHEGVLRAMLCGIGRRAGVHAVYWAYGVCFYDDEHRSTARITSQLPAAHAGGQRGKITVEAAGGLALTLVEHLVESIRQVSIGRPPEVIWERGQPGGAPGKGEQSTTKRAAFSEVRPVEVPRLPGQPQPVYVSYAWGGESEALVDEIERRLPPTLELKRDKSELRPGDWISRFMQEIGRAQFVLVVLSDKYVRSVYCMRELLYLHHTSLGEKEAFLHKLVPLTLSDLKISRAKDRAGYIQFWKHEREETEAKFAGLDHVSFGGEDRTELLAILDFQHHVSDMLAWVGDTLMPRGAELHSKGIDAAIELLLQRANGAGR